MPKSIPPRPARQSVIAAVAEEMAKKVAEWAEDDDADAYAEALAEVIKYQDDGYYLAKRLEGKIRISPDEDLVAILSQTSAKMLAARQGAVRQWVEEHNITPTKAVGDNITFTYIGSVLEGRLVYICKGSAKYDVLVPSSGDAKEDKIITIPYEDVIG